MTFNDTQPGQDTNKKQEEEGDNRIFNKSFFLLLTNLLVEILSLVTRFLSQEIATKCDSFKYVFLAKHLFEIVNKVYSILLETCFFNTIKKKKEITEFKDGMDDKDVEKLIEAHKKQKENMKNMENKKESISNFDEVTLSVAEV